VTSSPVAIPDQFRAEGFRFVKLGSTGEARKKPFEYFWDSPTLEDARRRYAEDLAAAGGNRSKSPKLQAGEPSRLTNYGFDDPALLQHLQRGGNYGIVNGTGPNGAGLATLDADNLPRLAELVDLPLLPPTLEAGRRGEDGEPIPERRHFHYLSDLEGRHLLRDPETGEVLGDLRGTGGFQVVGPGSLHPSGAVVEVLKDRPLAPINGGELLRILSPVLEAKTDTDRAKLEGLTKKRPPTTTDKDPFGDVSILDVIDVTGFKESGGQFFGEHPIHGSETGHNLVVNPAKNSWWCGRHETGGGPALWLAVEGRIIDCSEARSGALRGEKFLQTLDYARSRGLIPDDGRGESSTEGARDFIETVKEGLIEDPRKLKDRAVLAALLTLREKDPLEFDFLADELKGAGVIKLPTLKKMIDGEERRQADERARCGEEGGGVPDWLAPEVLEKAEAIMREGDPLQFLIFQSQRSHVGDINYQKVVLLSVAASNSLTSQGIHPGGTGDKGSGKTDAMKAVFHLLPPAPWKKSGSLSSLAPFYMGLPPGTIFYSDDVVWDLVGPVFRQATGSYQDGTIHNTLSKDREYRPLTIPPRFTWWLTSVEATHKEQENDRQYPISTDPRDEHKRIVSKEIGQRRARKERRLDVDEGVLVARAIIWLIKSHDPFKVLIPQAAKAEWSLFRDFRGQERFWDTVEAFAILRYMQRDEDPEGWLIATMEDIEAAKALFKADNLAHATKLTKAETALLGVMLDGGEFSQADLARALGISQQAVSDRLTAIMGRTKYITSDRGQGGRVLYTINAGKEIDPSLWSDFEMVRIEGDEKPTTEEVTTLLQPPYNPLTGIPTTIKIDSSRRIPVSLQPKKGGESGGDLLGEDPKKSDEKHISLDDRVEKVVNPTNRQRPPLVEGCNRGCKDHVTEVVNPLVDEKSPSGGGCKPPGGEVVTVGEDSGRIFGLSLSFWRDLAARSGGLNTRALRAEPGFDPDKSAMALHLLRARGWSEDGDGRLHPPAEGVVG